MDNSLILITGAASGIGLHLAQTLRDKGCELVLIDCDAHALAREFQESDRLNFCVGDVVETETWMNALSIAKKRGRPYSHLFNIAGIMRPKFIADVSLEDLNKELEVNTKGSILGTKIIGDEMKFQEFGHIINVSSLAGLVPVSGLSLYTASKFAIRGFSLAVAAEYRDYGVDVSVVCPDLVQTPMLDMQLNFPDEAKLAFSGSRKTLRPENITHVLLRLMDSPKMQVCIPKSRGMLAKLAGSWPWVGEMVREILEKKGRNRILSLK